MEEGRGGNEGEEGGRKGGGRKKKKEGGRQRRGEGKGEGKEKEGEKRKGRKRERTWTGSLGSSGTLFCLIPQTLKIPTSPWHNFLFPEPPPFPTPLDGTDYLPLWNFNYWESHLKGREASFQGKFMTFNPLYTSFCI